MLKFIKSKLSWERFLMGLAFFLRLNLMFEISYSAYKQNWLILFASAAILVLTFLPFFFEKKYRIELPLDFEFAIILFIYAALFLGEIKDYYKVYWWWDLLLHASAGLAFGFIGFIILYLLYYKNKIQANPFLIVVFSFFFAMGLGAIWEIFEFGMDSLLSLNMQKSGLVDTMWDLVVNAAGALITSFVGYFYIRKKRVFLFSRLVNKFMAENKIKKR